MNKIKFRYIKIRYMKKNYINVIVLGKCVRMPMCGCVTGSRFINFNTFLKKIQLFSNFQENYHEAVKCNPNNKVYYNNIS